MSLRIAAMPSPAPAILGLLGNPELISFAGGFPDPATFPAGRVAELARDLDASAFQYAPTNGLEGTRDAIASANDLREKDWTAMDSVRCGASRLRLRRSADTAGHPDPDEFRACADGDRSTSAPAGAPPSSR